MSNLGQAAEMIRPDLKILWALRLIKRTLSRKTGTNLMLIISLVAKIQTTQNICQRLANPQFQQQLLRLLKNLGLSKMSIIRFYLPWELMPVQIILQSMPLVKNSTRMKHRTESQSQLISEWLQGPSLMSLESQLLGWYFPALGLWERKVSIRLRMRHSIKISLTNLKHLWPAFQSSDTLLLIRSLASALVQSNFWRPLFKE